MSDGTPEATVMAAEDFRDRVLDRLSVLGDITSRPMFDDWSIYREGVIFGIQQGVRLYFKADDRSKGDFESRGMGPFRPNERQALKSYDEVPLEVLADPEALLSWAGEAIRPAPSSQKPLTLTDCRYLSVEGENGLR